MQMSLRRLSAGALRRITRDETSIVIDKRLDELSPLPDDSQVAVREGSADDVRAFLTAAGDSDMSRRVECYVRNGYRSLVGVVGDELVGWQWRTDATTPSDLQHPHVDRMGIELGPGDAYGFEFFVLPAWRGRGIGTSFLAVHYRALKESGYSRIVASVEHDNHRARSIFEATGYRTVRVAPGRRVFWWLLFSEGRVFLLNTRRSRPTSFDYRRIWPRRRSEPRS